MNNTEIIILILAMALVTYVPRALPSVLVNKINFGEKTQKFLNLIPYTAMSALIFPGIFTIDKASKSTNRDHRWYSCNSISMEEMLCNDMCSGSYSIELFIIYHIIIAILIYKIYQNKIKRGFLNE